MAMLCPPDTQQEPERLNLCLLPALKNINYVLPHPSAENFPKGPTKWSSLLLSPNWKSSCTKSVNTQCL